MESSADTTTATTTPHNTPAKISSTQFDTLSSSQSNVEKRKGIKEAYQGKVLVNRAEVLDVHFVPSSKGLSTEKEEIDRIVKLVQQNCSKEIESLKDLANSASPVSKRSKTTMVQALKEDALTGGLGNNHLKKLEREMYRPLVRISHTARFQLALTVLCFSSSYSVLSSKPATLTATQGGTSANSSCLMHRASFPMILISLTPSLQSRTSLWQR